MLFMSYPLLLDCLWWLSFKFWSCAAAFQLLPVYRLASEMYRDFMAAIQGHMQYLSQYSLTVMFIIQMAAWWFCGKHYQLTPRRNGWMDFFVIRCISRRSNMNDEMSMSK